MKGNCILKIDLRGYWHAGGGRGGGAVVDAVVHRDSNGLPVVPGRHIKGLLRDALERAEAWGWDGCDGMSEVLFGARTETAQADTVPTPGCLRIGDARLPAEVADWLGSKVGSALRPQLFRSIYASSVEHQSGTALDKSLRGIEVAVPLTMDAPISIIPGCTAPDDWKENIAYILPLINAVGAHRTRGLGRAVLTLEVNS